MDKVNDDLSPLEKTPGLDSELDKLRDLMNRLAVTYKAKKDAMENSISPDSKGQKQTHAMQRCINEARAPSSGSHNEPQQVRLHPHTRTHVRFFSFRQEHSPPSRTPTTNPQTPLRRLTTPRRR